MRIYFQLLIINQLGKRYISSAVMNKKFLLKNLVYNINYFIIVTNLRKCLSGYFYHSF